MRKKYGDPLASLGGVIGVWAVVLLVWTFYISLFPSADYELNLEDESVSMTGKRGETISILFEPGDSMRGIWATPGIFLSLTSPGLEQLDLEVVPFTEPDWEDEIEAPSLVSRLPVQIRETFTIPATLGESESPSTGLETTESVTYTGFLDGIVVVPVVVDETTYTNSSLPLLYTASLTVVPGLVTPSSAWWSLTKAWFGPRWRNFWIFAGVGGGIFVTGRL
jgi:hypothetical protein